MTYSGNTKEKLSEASRKYVLSVAYWRFFVNALLVLCDMTAFIIASAIVYVVRNAGDLYSTRFPLLPCFMGVYACRLADLDILPAQCGRVPPSCDG